MPRIVYVLIFLIVTLAPFPVIWVGQFVLGINNAKSDLNTSQNQVNSTNSSYRSPFYGGFFYAGSRGRGGWLGRSYRTSTKSFGGSRSYSGGSSFGGGSFGSFGK